MKFYRLSYATFYDRINTMYQFIKSVLDNKMSIFELMTKMTDTYIGQGIAHSAIHVLVKIIFSK